MPMSVCVDEYSSEGPGLIGLAGQEGGWEDRGRRKSHLPCVTAHVQRYLSYTLPGRPAQLATEMQRLCTALYAAPQQAEHRPPPPRFLRCAGPATQPQPLPQRPGPVGRDARPHPLHQHLCIFGETSVDCFQDSPM